MSIIIESIIVFLSIIKIFIFIDVILSYVSFFANKNIRPKIITDILDPLYESISKILPTKISGIDFSPLILIIFIELLGYFLGNIFYKL